MKKIACIFLIFFSCFFSIFAQEKTVGELNDLAVEYYKSGAFYYEGANGKEETITLSSEAVYIVNNKYEENHQAP